MPRADEHAHFVDDWLTRHGTGLPPEALLRLFEAALGALWARTSRTLGVVTLSAIADRVVYSAAQEFPALSCLRVDPDAGIQVHELGARLAAGSAPELRDGIRFVLVELLTVLGGLTAEVLTPQLRSELSKVTAAASAPLHEPEPGEPAAPDDPKDGGRRS